MSDLIQKETQELLVCLNTTAKAWLRLILHAVRMEGEQSRMAEHNARLADRVVAEKEIARLKLRIERERQTSEKLRAYIDRLNSRKSGEA